MLLQALEVTLRVPANRLILRTSEEKLAKQWNSYNPEFMRQPELLYEVVLAPDSFSD
jgi:hypothetical protein